MTRKTLALAALLIAGGLSLSACASMYANKPVAAVETGPGQEDGQ